jgi:hypothetical protein
MAGGSSGDLYVKIHVSADPRFKKDGSNLVTELSVKLSDALLGAEYKIQTLDGEEKVDIPQGITHGEIITIKGVAYPWAVRPRQARRPPYQNPHHAPAKTLPLSKKFDRKTSRRGDIVPFIIELFLLL